MSASEVRTKFIFGIMTYILMLYREVPYWAKLHSRRNPAPSSSICLQRTESVCRISEMHPTQRQARPPHRLLPYRLHQFCNLSPRKLTFLNCIPRWQKQRCMGFNLSPLTLSNNPVILLSSNFKPAVAMTYRDTFLVSTGWMDRASKISIKNYPIMPNLPQCSSLCPAQWQGGLEAL